MTTRGKDDDFAGPLDGLVIDLNAAEFNRLNIERMRENEPRSRRWAGSDPEFEKEIDRRSEMKKVKKVQPVKNEAVSPPAATPPAPADPLPVAMEDITLADFNKFKTQRQNSFLMPNDVIQKLILSRF